MQNYPKQAEQLLRLRDKFAGMDNRLFHATRVMIQPEQEKADDLTSEWEQFLPDELMFGHTAFRTNYPKRRVQHFCFYGSRELLYQFTGLAAKAALEPPLDFLPGLSPNPTDREARADRDQWILAVYRAAYLAAGRLPVTRDLQGHWENELEPVDRGFFDPLSLASNYDSAERHGFTTWQESFTKKQVSCPRYLYATLSLDVATSSLIAIDFLIKNWESLFRPILPDDITDVELLNPAVGSQNAPTISSLHLGIEFDKAKRRVSRDGRETELSPISYELFEILLRGKGATVSYRVLANAWREGILPSDAMMHSQVRTLRKSLQQLGLEPKNDRSIGYKLVEASRVPLPRS